MSNGFFSLPAFAKINWSLHIHGKRADGYHEVTTCLQSISLHDDLHFNRRDDTQIRLSCDDAEIPTDESNLIIRAARSLCERYRVQKGATIRLEKRIPTNGGLGGASSNAAAALLGLAYLWDLKSSVSELVEIAAGLGADVPFFLVGGRALARGTGAEVLTLPEAATVRLIIVKPNASVSTAAAYELLRAPALTTAIPDSKLASSRGGADFEHSNQTVLHNDFEPVIFLLKPEIERAKMALIEAGASGGLLAGSGSSVFGIFDDQEVQKRALRDIRTEAGWRVFPCATLSRKEYWRAAESCLIPLSAP